MRRLALAISCAVIVIAAVSLAGIASAEVEKFWEMGGAKVTTKFEVEVSGNLKVTSGTSSLDCPTHMIVTANENNKATSTGLIHFSLDEEFTKKCTGVGDTFKDCQVKEVEDTFGATYTWQYHLTETKDKSKEMIVTNAVVKYVLESVAGKKCPDTTLKFNYPKVRAIPDIDSNISSFTFEGEGTLTVDEKEGGSTEVSGSEGVLGENQGTYGFI